MQFPAYQDKVDEFFSWLEANPEWDMGEIVIIDSLSAVQDASPVVTTDSVVANEPQTSAQSRVERAEK